jgi:hypothetical protein
VAVFTKTIHSTREQHIHLTKTAQYIARIFTVQYKYMNISTIQVRENYKTAENRKYRRKHDEYTAREITLAVKLVAIAGSGSVAPPYTECPRRNVPYFGRVFLMLEYTDITQNTYVQS